MHIGCMWPDDCPLSVVPGSPDSIYLSLHSSSRCIPLPFDIFQFHDYYLDDFLPIMNGYFSLNICNDPHQKFLIMRIASLLSCPRVFLIQFVNFTFQLIETYIEETKSLNIHRYVILKYWKRYHRFNFQV